MLNCKGTRYRLVSMDIMLLTALHFLPSKIQWAGGCRTIWYNYTLTGYWLLSVIKQFRPVAAQVHHFGVQSPL